jgi:hypothetical protein
MNAALFTALTLAAAPDLDLAIAATGIAAKGHTPPIDEVSLTEAVASGVAWFPEVRLVSKAEMDGGMGRRFDEGVRGCGASTDCIGRVARSASLTHVIVVVANFATDPPIVGVELVPADPGGNSANEVITVSGIHASKIAESVSEAVIRILSALGLEKCGRVVVKVSPEDARVSVSGMPSAGGVWTLDAGVHPVVAARDGYEAHAGEVAVKAGEVTPVTLILEPERPFYTSPWFWAAVGAVAVAGGTAAGLWLSGDDGPETVGVCVFPDPARCGR